MKHCANCGTVLQPGVTVCPNCQMPTPYNAIIQPPPPPSPAQSPSYGNVGNAPNPNAPTEAIPHYPPQAFPQYPQYGNVPGAQPYGGYNNPQGTPYQPYTPVQGNPLPPAPASNRPQRTISTGRTVLLLVLTLVLLVSGIGLIYYTTVFHPAQLHAQATATVSTQYTAVAHVTGTAQAQVTGTAQAYAHATATVVAQVTAQAQATVTAQQAIYTQATSSTPVLDDSLAANSANKWTTYNNLNGSGRSCTFTGGALHATTPRKGDGAPCFAQGRTFDNFAYQVQMQIVSGDSGGVFFRTDNTGTTAYLFIMNVDGRFVLAADQGGKTRDLASGTSSAFKTGLNQPNVLTTIARGNTIYIYINSQYVAFVTDSTATTGYLGVIGLNVNTGNSDVAFSNAKAWTL